MPRGKLLGGSSAINGMAFVRGQAQDFDTWAQMGNQGWSYDDVLPFFKRMESYDGGDDAFRGRDGPLRVTNPPPRAPFFAALIKAAGQVGIPHNPDYNGAAPGRHRDEPGDDRGGPPHEHGALLSRPDPQRGRICRSRPARWPKPCCSTASAAPACAIPSAAQTHEARAAREVVVSAGTINSPQLLELSGIGQPERLRDLGIEVRHALPGVGENLRDHYAPRTRWAIGAKGITYNDRGRGLGLVWQALRYALFRAGPAGHAWQRRSALSCARARAWRRRTCCSAGCPMLTEPGPTRPEDLPRNPA